jgi:hypothetical protein
MSSLEQNDIYYSIYADINSDDDFELDIGYDVKLTGFSTEKEAAEALAKTLLEAKLVWSKKWSIRHTNEQGEVTSEDSGDYDSAWTYVRDEAVQELQAGNTHFRAGGGNQSIEVWTAMNSRRKNREFKEALMRVSPEDRKILGLLDPNSIEV